MKKLKEIIFNTGGNLVYLASIWLMTVLAVRLADFKTAGVFSLAITVTNIFYCISIYGMRSFQVSDVVDQFSDRVYFFSRHYTSVMGLLLCFLYCILSRFSVYQICAVMLYMMFKTVEAYSDVSYGFFQKYNHFDYIFYALSCKGLLSLTLFSLILFVSKDLLITLICMTLGVGFVYVFYELKHTNNLVGKLTGQKKEERKKIWELLQSTFLLMLIQIATQMLIAFPRVYFEAQFGSELFGYYSSISAPTIVISTFATCAMMPFIPKFAEYQHAGFKKECYTLLAGTVGATILFGAVCYLGAMWLGEFVLALLYTEDVLRYANVLLDIIVSTTFSALVMCLSSFFVATRKIKIVALLLFIGCACSYFFTPVLIDQFQMVGICYTMSISQLIQVIFMLIIACVEINSWTNRKVR